MALTISEKRYQEIKAEMERRRLAKNAAEIDAETDWNAQPAFSDVDGFLEFLDKQASPKNRPARSRRSKR